MWSAFQLTQTNKSFFYNLKKVALFGKFRKIGKAVDR